MATEYTVWIAETDDGWVFDIAEGQGRIKNGTATSIEGALGRAEMELLIHHRTKATAP